MKEEIHVGTSREMRDLGRELAGLLKAGDIVILSGPLGAGETTLTQGIGEGLGVRGPVTSPTFVIARVHPVLPNGVTPLVHVDAYRLGSAVELDDLDLDADVDSAVTVVEWGEGLAEGLAQDRLEISIERDDACAAPVDDSPDEPGLSDEPRTVRITGMGPRWQDIRMTRTGVSDRL